MDRGERQDFIFVAAGDYIFAGERLRRAVAFGGQERKLGQELFGRVVARAVLRELAQVFEARFGVLVSGGEVGFVAARKHEFDLA